jgi:hypothetical protein
MRRDLPRLGVPCQNSAYILLPGGDGTAACSEDMLLQVPGGLVPLASQVHPIAYHQTGASGRDIRPGRLCNAASECGVVVTRASTTPKVMHSSTGLIHRYRSARPRCCTGR